MKKFFKYNTGAAVCALVLIAALSVFCGINRTVASYKSRVTRLFSSSSGGSAAEDIGRFKSFAGQLSAIAASNGFDTSDFDSSVSALSNGTPFEGQDSVIKDVSAKADAAYAYLSAKTDVDEQQMRSATSCRYEMASIVSRLQNNAEYNKAAEKYNKAVSSFPTDKIVGKSVKASTFNR